MAPPCAKLGEPLTTREYRMVALIARGMTNREVGEEVRLNEDQVKYALRCAMIKTGTTSRSALVAWGFAPHGFDQEASGRLVASAPPVIRHEPCSPVEAAQQLIRDAATVTA